MKRRRKIQHQPVTNPKNYLSEEAGVKNQAACLNRIYRKVDEEGLTSETLQELRDDIDYVGGLFHIDGTSVALLAAILEKSPTNHQMDDEDLAQYLGCTNIEFIRHHARLRDMDKAGIIQVGGRGGSGRFYVVSPEMLKAVENDEEFQPVKMTGLTSGELFSRFRKFFCMFGDDVIDADRLLEELDTLVNENPQLSFCRKVMESALYGECSETERRMFLYLCHRYVNYGEAEVPIDTLILLKGFFEDEEDVRRCLAHQKSGIQRCSLATFASGDGFADTTALSLADEVKESFFQEVERTEEEPLRDRDLIGAETIQAKELFYNPAESAQVERLEGLLDGENFRQVQQRLCATGMRKGFNAIFYGVPGTGKTASVYELARRSGRDILRVDVSRLKSKWVGESEKSVRGVFRMYRTLCRRSEKAPILLFNEADAIFARRIENAERSVDQMNNAVQNIILEEMESIDGILIATTNLTTNLDPAFERRFIFKVEFRLPGKESRERIWRSMVPTLSEEDAAVLAERYAFSGGSIENIARKSAVEYVLSGYDPTLSSLDGYCREEMLSRAGSCNKIGF